ncbi:hypothetical protein OOT46_24385 [Aquabacterium sp. A7-Y]|nr:hypothetical protein [Aquabacterium sp. A7-Y]MCW7540964.1 hypothetical protein [Aquabacterium sp. A7-Y]
MKFEGEFVRRRDSAGHALRRGAAFGPRFFNTPDRAATGCRIPNAGTAPAAWRARSLELDPVARSPRHVRGTAPFGDDALELQGDHLPVQGLAMAAHSVNEQQVRDRPWPEPLQDAAPHFKRPRADVDAGHHRQVEDAVDDVPAAFPAGARPALQAVEVRMAAFVQHDGRNDVLEGREGGDTLHAGLAMTGSTVAWGRTSFTAAVGKTASCSVR